MPEYLYESEKGEIATVFQHMNDVHEYIGPDGKKWNRVYTVPQASLPIDPFSAESFMEKTNKGGNLGQLMDLSNEMSMARAEKRDGVDPVRVNKIKESRKLRKGRATNVEIKEAKEKTYNIEF